MQATLSKHGKDWAEYEDKKMISLKSQGHTYDHIGTVLQRTGEACRQRLKYLKKDTVSYLDEPNESGETSKWSKQEEETLFTLRQQGVPYKIISLQINRSPIACEKKYQKTNWQSYFGTSLLSELEEKSIALSKKVDIREKITASQDAKMSMYKIRAEIIADRVSSAVEALPVVITAKEGSKNKNKIDPKKVREPEEMALVLSDLHIGAHHTLEETGGISEYNEEVVARRIENLKTAVLEIAEIHGQLYEIPVLHIFCLGDIVAGANNAGAWSNTYINLPIFDQMTRGWKAIADMIHSWLHKFPKIRFYGVRGNHGRCLDELTRILTPSGYKFYNEIKEGDLVGTVDIKSKEFSFQPVKKIHIFSDDKEIIRFKTSKFNILNTLDHDFLSKSKKGNLLKHSVRDILDRESTTLLVPSSFPSANSEYPIEDDILSLLGWIMTDGSYDDKSNSIRIYQSKLENQPTILSLTKDYSHSVSLRDRNVQSILGVKVKTQHPEWRLNLLSSDKVSRIKKLLPHRETIPQWMYDLSDRQVAVLLQSIVSGDGSIRVGTTGKDGYKREGGMDVVWGKKIFLEQLCGLLCSHGISASINRHKRKCIKSKMSGDPQISYYLQIRKRSTYSIKTKHISKESYSGITWCVTVDNGTIAVISGSGDAYFTGNCGLDGVEKDYCNWDYISYKYLEAAFSNNTNVEFVVPPSWWIFEEIKNHKFLLVHGDDVKGGSMPIRGLQNFEMKMAGILGKYPDYTIAGHFHNSAEMTTNSGRIIINGAFVGSDVYSLKTVHAASRPEQKVFGIHSKHGMTWSYNINLDHNRL